MSKDTGRMAGESPFRPVFVDILEAGFTRFFWTFRGLPCFFGHIGPHFSCSNPDCNSLPGFIGHILAEKKGGPFPSPYFFGHISTAKACPKGVIGLRTPRGMRNMTTLFWRAKVGRDGNGRQHFTFINLT